MKRVDHMLSYLSGEMEEEDRRAFEADLERNDGLKEEFDQLSRAWTLVRDELREEDETAFQSTLLEAMSGARAREGISRGRKRLWWFLIPLAASLAIILATPMMKKQKSAFLRFYHPEEDGIVQALGQEYRNSGQDLASLYALEAFDDCYFLAANKLKQDGDKHLARLFLYLAALESGKEVQALAEGGHPTASTSPLDQAILWYRTLLLLKTGDEQGALAEAERLLESKGPYAGDAEKLKKMLTK